MKPQFVAALGAGSFIAVVAPSVVRGDVIEFRIVERTGQTMATPADNVLDFAIQARVTGGGSLSSFSFDSLRLVGEPESYGQLARGIISNGDGTYATGFGTSGTVGVAGLARTFSFDAGINASLNGVINVSAGSFTNTPDQEIGIVAANAVGSPMLATPGIDVDGDGNPDTWPGNGGGGTPPNMTHASVDPTILQTYFAQGQFIDIYRFRYTVTNFTPRTLHFATLNLGGTSFNNQLTYNNGLWGAPGDSSATWTFQADDLTVAPGPGIGAALAIGAGVVGLRRRR
jgi:hypothetical protein